MKKTQKTADKNDYKTAWDFTSFYSGPTDIKLEKDVELIEKAYATFSKKYSKDSTFLENESALLKALTDYEKMLEITETSKPLWYLKNLASIDSQNKDIHASLAKYEPRVVKAYNTTLFFTLKLGKISKESQQQFLNSKVLKHYNHFLKMIFENAQFDLSEDAEKVMSLKMRTSYTMWVDGFKKLISKITVDYKVNGKDKKIPLGQAITLIHQLPTKERRELSDKCMEALKSISYFAEHEINAVITDKKIEDELRGYKTPYESTVRGYQNNLKNIETLVKTVTEHFPIAHSFARLKAKMLKLKSLSYADRAVGIDSVARKVSFDEAIELVESGFSKAGTYYADTFRKMLREGRIDVYSKVGKVGGAYCWGGINVPTLVMLNYNDSYDGVSTLAHELGHAIHTELSKKPSPIYQHYTISVAEVASTFFENLVFEEIYERLSDEEKVSALFNKVADKIQVIFRQIACFNMEVELHDQIRKNGMISVEEMGAIHNKHMKAYLGDVYKMTELDGYFILNWSHIRRYFYVYSYAYGELISQALYKKCKEDKTFYTKVNAFMEAGATMTPDDIFKSIGIDTSKPDFYKLGLKSIEEDIIKLEKLLSKKPKLK